jgi:hypothetical protein
MDMVIFTDGGNLQKKKKGLMCESVLEKGL